ncbi:glycerophosphodiester phosphodiesterase [Aureibacillus halotolerans]|uniref:Glycerophosphoryl diester phosphodiesterase n=1 Tax=Aureibacillus halotolerans TaxID=1508390 RepID=A0A4R6U934_9BACI|nr:glycerophosphodiester phosphodiesterase [Aureibacillus halotolerans]TDQ41175.1 glycerophosphoryl diester phosphodiesterase [Aureibacillus halotolerans]
MTMSRLAKFPLITAHTGCMGYPEHSLESVQAAMSLGADVYEDDIRATCDGVAVLAHDNEVRLADGQNINIATMSTRELDEAILQADPSLADSPLEPFPRAEALMRVVKNARAKMNLDIKTDASLKPVFDLIVKLGMQEHAFLSGCGYETAAEALRLQNRLGLVIHKLLNVDASSFKRMNYDEAVAMACEHALETKCFGLNAPYHLVQPVFLEEAAAHGLDVYVWTLEKASDMRKMAEMGVASITTRDPATLIAVKNEWETARDS